MFFSFGLIARLEIVTFNFDNDYLVTEKPNVNVLFFLFHFFSFFLFFFHISSHSEVKSINISFFINFYILTQEYLISRLTFQPNDYIKIKI